MRPSDMDAIGRVIAQTVKAEVAKHAAPVPDDERIAALEKRIDELTKAMPTEGPQGPAGPQGDAGPQGPAGFEGERGADGPQGERGADAPPPNDVQVIEAVKAIYPTIRADLVKALPGIEHKGVHEAGEEYAPGDEVIKGDSTYRAKHTTREAPPHDDWQCIAKSKVGRKGADGGQGPQGPAGADGVGITDDWVVEDGLFVIKLTDESVVTLDLSGVIAKAVEDFLKGDNNGG